MSKFEAVAQQQKPGEKLMSDFESLQDGADSDAAVEFVYKNRNRVASDMDSEEAWDLLQKLPHRTNDASYGEMLKGALQATNERSMKAEPGTDMTEAFKKRGAQTGVAFLEKNLDVIDPEQVADIIATLEEIDFPYSEDPNEKRKQDQFRARVDALLEKVESIELLEAKRDAAGKPELHVVSEKEARVIESVRERFEILHDAFGAYKGNLSEHNKAKVERWQKELYSLREAIGQHEMGSNIDTLYEQMRDYVRAVDRASKARETIARQGRAEDIGNDLAADRARQARVTTHPLSPQPLSIGSKVGGWFKKTFGGK